MQLIDDSSTSNMEGAMQAFKDTLDGKPGSNGPSTPQLDAQKTGSPDLSTSPNEDEDGTPRVRCSRGPPALGRTPRPSSVAQVPQGRPRRWACRGAAASRSSAPGSNEKTLLRTKEQELARAIEASPHTQMRMRRDVNHTQTAIRQFA